MVLVCRDMCTIQRLNCKVYEQPDCGLHLLRLLCFRLGSFSVDRQNAIGGGRKTSTFLQKREKHWCAVVHKKLSVSRWPVSYNLSIGMG